MLLIYILRYHLIITDLYFLKSKFKKSKLSQLINIMYYQDKDFLYISLSTKTQLYKHSILFSI